MALCGLLTIAEGQAVISNTKFSENNHS